MPVAPVLHIIAFVYPESGWRAIVLTAALVVFCAGLIGVLTRASRRLRSKAVLRLDHFLPFVRRRRFPAGPPAILVRLARRVLPAAFFFDPVTGAEGTLRRWCRKLGASVLAAPLRRLVQAACLAAFLALFFVVCWPYDARPVGSGVISPGWQFLAIDQQTGALRFASTSSSIPAMFPQAGTVFLSSNEHALFAAKVQRMSADDVVLLPVKAPDSEELQTLLLSTGTWTIHELEPGKWPSHYADNLARKELIPADTFLILDPLVSISTAIASRSWVWSLVSATVILIVCVLIPRGFCGYVCPLGSLIDLFDRAIGKRVTRFRVAADGWWVHIKYYLLAGTLIAAAFGVLVSGFVAAIPVITRGMLFLCDPLQSGFARGWHLVPPVNAGHVVSVALFLGVLGLGLLRPRFWCKYVCPSGAVFSLGNLFRVVERKVESSCIQCNKCVTVCPFDAIKPDFTTRVTDCTLCQTCGGVCPSHSIKFVERWNVFELKEENVPATGETAIGRRGFVSLAAGTAAAFAGGTGMAGAARLFGAELDQSGSSRPVRPPGSVPEEAFLQMCIRCGECFKACPNNVLQPLGFGQGLQGLWTPAVNADWAGCESSCNACGQVCPTGAILPLPLEEKKDVRMGLAIVDEEACLPFAEREACQLCVDECAAAGYNAIEFTRVGTDMDASGAPLEGSGFLAPVVIPDKCVGCGLCQTRCNGINAEQKRLLSRSAIVIKAGSGREDRFTRTSHLQWRQQRQAVPSSDRAVNSLSPPPSPATAIDDPFAELE